MCATDPAAEGFRVSSGAVNAVIVGAALVRDGKLLAQQRAWPPKHAGQWELPGGRVQVGESPDGGARFVVVWRAAAGGDPVPG